MSNRVANACIAIQLLAIVIFIAVMEVQLRAIEDRLDEACTSLPREACGPEAKP